MLSVLGKGVLLAVWFLPRYANAVLLFCKFLFDLIMHLQKARHWTGGGRN